jgi:hypothetical protein
MNGLGERASRAGRREPNRTARGRQASGRQLFGDGLPVAPHGASREVQPMDLLEGHLGGDVLVAFDLPLDGP